MFGWGGKDKNYSIVYQSTEGNVMFPYLNYDKVKYYCSCEIKNF